MLERPAAIITEPEIVGDTVEVFIDIETRNRAVDLPAVGAHLYTTDPHTEIQCVCFAIDNGPVQVWTPNDPAVPAEIIAVATNADFIAHNASFEIDVINHILAPRYGWPKIPLRRWRCTMATAQANALPAKLERLGEALDLPHRKDVAGARLMTQMTKPRAPRKGEDPDATYWYDDEDRMVRLAQYCAVDVEVCRDAYYAMPALSDSELQLWRNDQIINQRGIYFDRPLTEAARRIAALARPELDLELAAVTDGAVTRASQVPRLKVWLAQQGCSVESLDKEAIEQLLATALPPPVRRSLELRQAGAKSSTAKLDAILAGLDADDRARGLFAFHAASTGRWSSRRIQVHNFPRRGIKNIEPAIATIMSGDLERVRAVHPRPLELISNILRALICAPPGRILFGADFSSVESRVLAWLANEPRKLKAYRDFDATHDSKFEPYVVVASQLFGVPLGTFTADSPQRAIGKVADLAFGYMGGINAWRAFEPDKLNPLPDDQVEAFKQRWRASHPNIVRFWYALEDASVAAVLRPGQTMRCGRVAFKFIDESLYLKLPSARLLCYPQARVEYDYRRRKRVYFQDNGAGRWTKDSAYGGLLTENVVSGTARDLLVHAMNQVECGGFDVISHVHDELLVEVDEADVGYLNAFTSLVTDFLPPWAEGLPFAAKTWSGRRYTK